MDIETTKQTIKERLPLITFSERNSQSKMFYHWEIILVTFLLFNILLLVSSWYLFLHINEGDIFLIEQDKNAKVDTIDRGALSELLESFDVKGIEFEGRLESVPSLSDPSR